MPATATLEVLLKRGPGDAPTPRGSTTIGDRETVGSPGAAPKAQQSDFLKEMAKVQAEQFQGYVNAIASAFTGGTSTSGKTDSKLIELVQQQTEIHNRFGELHHQDLGKILDAILSKSFGRGAGRATPTTGSDYAGPGALVVRTPAMDQIAEMMRTQQTALVALQKKKNDEAIDVPFAFKRQKPPDENRSIFDQLKGWGKSLMGEVGKLDRASSVLDSASGIVGKAIDSALNLAKEIKPFSPSLILQDARNQFRDMATNMRLAGREGGNLARMEDAINRLDNTVKEKITGPIAQFTADVANGLDRIIRGDVSWGELGRAIITSLGAEPLIGQESFGKKIDNIKEELVKGNNIAEQARKDKQAKDIQEAADFGRDMMDRLAKPPQLLDSQKLTPDKFPSANRMEDTRTQMPALN
jgi:hypothetical protein